MTNFKLHLGDTYWSKGFFNVSVDFERFLTLADGPIDIFLGNDARPLVGRITRSANRNATPRIFGNKPLADFFQKNFKKGGFVSVEIVSPEAVRIGGGAAGNEVFTKPAPTLTVRPSNTTTPRRTNLVEPSPTSSASQIDIHQLYGHLARFCEGLWKRQQKAPTPSDFASLISGLQRQNLVPAVEAGMMHTVRTVRNSLVHDHRRLGPREIRVITAAWEVITQWAQREHVGLWKGTRDLP